MVRHVDDVYYTMGAGESDEARFARKLASNDLRTRSKALRGLKKWMTARSAVEDGGCSCSPSVVMERIYDCARRSLPRSLQTFPYFGTLFFPTHLYSLSSSPACPCLSPSYPPCPTHLHSLSRLLLSLFLHSHSFIRAGDDEAVERTVHVYVAL